MFPNMIIVVLLLSLFPAISTSASSPSSHNFLLCLTSAAVSFSGHIHTPADPNYSTFLQSAIRDPKFNTTQTPKPSLILTPDSLSQIQAAVSCSRKHGLHIRVRSGGHDYEGLSYTSNNSSSKFAVLDLVNFRGFGLLVRKFGLAADNVVDAILVDSNGRVVDRKSMGEDLFWAIRGGGGNSFGIVVSWKVKLFSVPEKLTSFSVQRTLPPNDGKLVHRWQTVANELPRDLIIEVVVSNRNISTSTSRIGTSTIAIFNALFLGKTEELLKLMQRSFPELGIRKQDCREMSWVEAIVFHGQSVRRWLHSSTLATGYQGKGKAISEQSLFCRYCKKTNHNIEDCLKLKNKKARMAGQYPPSAGFAGSVSRDAPGNCDGAGSVVSVARPSVQDGTGIMSLSSEDVARLKQLLSQQIPLPSLSSAPVHTNAVTTSAPLHSSDYVQVPTPEAALLKIWKKFDDIDVGSSAMVMVPFGGKMNEIDATSIPFPHRIGKLYQIQYLSYWSDDRMEDKHVRWIRELYDYVEPYVSKDPRSAYVNYRDLDIGVNGGDESGGTSYGQAK
ncbi:Berberine bridge enzyme-like 28, partial [Linum perenne]